MVLIDMDELANLHVMYSGLLEPGARGLRDRTGGKHFIRLTEFDENLSQ